MHIKKWRGRLISHLSNAHKIHQMIAPYPFNFPSVDCTYILVWCVHLLVSKLIDWIHKIYDTMSESNVTLAIVRTKQLHVLTGTLVRNSNELRAQVWWSTKRSASFSRHVALLLNYKWVKSSRSIKSKYFFQSIE